MNREEIEDRLSELRKSNPSVFVEAKYEVLDDTKTGNANVEQSKGKNAKKLEHHKD